jgi:5'-nucleotidase
MLILIDQDNVLADFEQGFLDAWQAGHPDKEFIACIDRKCFHVKDDYPKSYSEFVEATYAQPGFFRGLKPVLGALAAVRELMGMGHEIHICTSPINRYHNCVREKYEWVEEHLGFAFTKRMILTKDKTLVRGDILIDDKPKITGLHTPVWQHYLYNRPFNQTITNVPRLTWQNWKEVLPLE